MRTGIAVLLGMVMSLGQGSAHAATDWDTKLRTEFQRLISAPETFSLRSATPASIRRDMTILLVQTRRHWEELSSETQALAKPWLQRPVGPTDPGEAQWSFKNPETTFITPSGNFKIHYINKAQYPNDPNASVKAWVETDVASILDNVSSVVHGTLGYTAVPSDGVKGGDAKFDVYLTNLFPYGFYGYVSGDAPTNDAARPYGVASYMVLDNDYLSYGYSDPSDPLKVTAAHEYFHAVQNGYSGEDDIAFMEQSATWMEDIVYPTIHDNYNYIGEPYQDTDSNGQYDASVDGFTTADDHNQNGTRDEGSLDYPESPLNAFDSPPLVQYGRFLWARYLSEKFANSIVKTIWENCGQVMGDNTFSAMNAALQARGSSLAAAYQEYATWGYDKAKYSDGANYPLVWVDRTVNGSNLQLSSAGSPSLSSTLGRQQYLSTIYTQILNPSGSYTFASLGGEALLTILVNTGGLTLMPVTVTLTNGTGQWVAPSGALKAIAVVSNVALSFNDMSWSLNTSGMASSQMVPRLDSVVRSTGEIIPWQSGNVTVRGVANQDLIFKIVASDSNGSGDVPSISVLNNSTGGIFSPKTGNFTWVAPMNAGTYTLQVAAYAATDVSISTSGTITIVIDPVPRARSSRGGSFDGWYLVFLTVVGIWRLRRRISMCRMLIPVQTL